MKINAAAMCLSLVLIIAESAGAAVLIDSGSPSAPIGGLTIYAQQTAAQQFTLPVGAQITEVSALLARSGSGPAPIVKVQITKGIGADTPLTSLIAEFSLTVDNYVPTFLPIAADFFLEAGTYYVVVSSTTTLADNASWGSPAPTELGLALLAVSGNVDAAFPPSSRLLPTGNKFGLRISGNLLPPPPSIAHTPLLYIPSTRTNLVTNFTTHSVLRFNEIGDFTDAFVPDRSGGVRNPRATIMGPDGNLYVSSFSTAGNGVTGVLRYNGSTGAFIDVFAQRSGLDPFGLAFGPDGHLYVADFSANAVLRFNGQTGVFIDIFTSGASPLAPRGLVFGPDGNLYVSSPGNSRVLRFDGRTGASLGIFATGVDARDLVFGADANLYVASFSNNSVLRFNGTTGAFVDTFALGGGLDGPVGLRFGPDGDLYVGSFNNYGVLRYDGASGAFMDIFVHYGKGGLGQPRIFTFIVPVAIDILPGNDVNEINAKSKGMLPVAIFSSESFDATQIDATSLRLAGASVNQAGTKLKCHQEDVGGAPSGGPDGMLDLVCQFNSAEVQLEAGSVTAVLTGRVDGVPIRGEDGVVPVGF